MASLGALFGLVLQELGFQFKLAKVNTPLSNANKQGKRRCLHSLP